MVIYLIPSVLLILQRSHPWLHVRDVRHRSWRFLRCGISGISVSFQVHITERCRFSLPRSQTSGFGCSVLQAGRPIRAVVRIQLSFLYQVVLFADEDEDHNEDDEDYCDDDEPDEQDDPPHIVVVVWGRSNSSWTSFVSVNIDGFPFRSSWASGAGVSLVSLDSLYSWPPWLSLWSRLTWLSDRSRRPTVARKSLWSCGSLGSCIALWSLWSFRSWFTFFSLWNQNSKLIFLLEFLWSRNLKLKMVLGDGRSMSHSCITEFFKIHKNGNNANIGSRGFTT